MYLEASPPFPIPQGFNPAVVQLLRGLLDKNPQLRYNIEVIMVDMPITEVQRLADGLRQATTTERVRGIRGGQRDGNQDGPNQPQHPDGTQDRGEAALPG